MSEAEIKAKIEEVDSLLRMLEDRKHSLLKALEALKMSIRFENKFDFNPPTPKESRPFKNFLVSKIFRGS